MRQVHLLHQESHQTHRSPAVSSKARRAAVVLPIGSNFLRLLEYYFLQPSEYRFLICQINGDYPPLITTLLKLQHSFYQSQLQLVVVAAMHGDPVVFASDALA